MWVKQDNGQWAATCSFDVPSGFDPKTLTLHDTQTGAATATRVIDRTNTSNPSGAYSAQGTLTVAFTAEGTA